MRNSRKFFQASLWVCSLVLLAQPVGGATHEASEQTGSTSAPAPTDRDGQHDFDFEIGTWKTHLKRLLHPLTGSTTWVEYDGTSVVRKVWDGRANLLELEVDGPAGHIEALSLRLYNPDSHQWSLNFSNSAAGAMSQPAIGEFKNGRGEFYDQESLNGRAILVRFVIFDITPDSCRFEQSFSDDEGKTWEPNWIATDTRVKDEPAHSADAPAPQPAAPPSSSNRESRDEAWWTGPLLAPNATTMPPGHFLVEPYLYDVVGPHSNGFGSLTYINYGLMNRVTVGLIPTFGYNKVSNGPSSSGPGMGDVTLQAQFGLTSFHEGSWVPTTAFNVQETFPSGKYDRLNGPSAGLGAGAYTTTLAFYSQTFFWMPTGRILRARFNVLEAFPGRVSIAGVSSYGTAAGFSGHAQPGSSTLVDIAGEYSLTQHWVLATDVTYRHAGNTRVTGMNLPDSTGGQNPATVLLALGTTDAFGFAPAIEYNWKHNLGVILGTRVIPAGHNTPVTFSPAIAINYFR
jgi:hypothetical protein